MINILIILLSQVFSLKQEKIIYISTINSAEKRLYIRDKFHTSFPFATLQSPLSIWNVINGAEANDYFKIDSEDEIGTIYSHSEKINNQMYKVFYSYGRVSNFYKTKMNSKYEDNQISLALKPYNKSHSLTHLLYEAHEIDRLMFGISTLDSRNYQFFCFGAVPPHIGYVTPHGSCDVVGDTWGCELKSVYYTDLFNTMYKSNRTYRAIFEHMEQNILVSKEYFEFIKDTFFKGLLDRKICTLEYSKTTIFCDSEGDFNVFPNFTNFEFNGVTLSLYRRDFIEGNEMFIIRQTDPLKYNPDEWVFGYKFMKRFNMFFDYESRKITFYLNASLKARVFSNIDSNLQKKLLFATFNILCFGVGILIMINHSVKEIFI